MTIFNHFDMSNQVGYATVSFISVFQYPAACGGELHFFKQGRIIDKGNYKELLERKAMFRKMAKIQRDQHQ